MKKQFIMCMTLLLVAVCATIFPVSAQSGTDVVGFSKAPIIPTAKDGKVEWKYTTTSPANTWMNKNSSPRVR